MARKPPPDESLAAVDPKLVLEWHPTKNGDLKPADFFPNSHTEVYWRCVVNPDHDDWQARIQSRHQGRGCPDCARERNRGRRRNQTSLLEGCPSVAAEWHPTKNGSLSPDSVSLYSKKKVWWRCLMDPTHDDWPARVDNRVRQREMKDDSGCPMCSGRVATPEDNLAVKYPEVASSWHPTKNAPLTPEQIKPNSHLKVVWRCLSDPTHENWTTSVAHRTENDGEGTQCPQCRNRVPTPSNCLAGVNPDLALEWHPTKNGSVTPSDVLAGSNKKAWWDCPTHGPWEATIASRNIGAGCRDCADWGVSPLDPGLIYLIERAGVAKVGIANATDPSECRRLAKHSRAGFSVVAIWQFDRLADAQSLEGMVLEWWRSGLGLPPALPRGEDGWTETVSLDALGADRVVQFVDERISLFDLPMTQRLEPS